MAEKKARSKNMDLDAFESSLTALGRKLSGAVTLKEGSILIRFADSGYECYMEGTGREMRITKSVGDAHPLVEVSGPAATIKAIIEGKKDPVRAFIAGGIRVQGDLLYLEALLKDICLLNCDESSTSAIG